METSTHVVESADRGLKLGQACENFTGVAGIDAGLPPELGKTCALVEVDGERCSSEVTGEQLVRTNATAVTRTFTKRFQMVRSSMHP